MPDREYLVGPRLTHIVKDGGLDKNIKFNSWIGGKLLIVIPEVHIGDRREVMDALKPLITDRRIEIEAKGQDQVMRENHANFILTTNHRNAIQKTRDDRRYAIFYTAQQTRADVLRDMPAEYVTAFQKWLDQGGLADIAGYLNAYRIPDHLNPATNLHDAPYTSSTEAAIQESAGIIEQENHERHRGTAPGLLWRLGVIVAA